MPYRPTPWIRRGAAAFMALAFAASVEAAVVDQSNLITSPLQSAQSFPVLAAIVPTFPTVMQSFTPTFDRLDWAAAGLSVNWGSVTVRDLANTGFWARIWSTGSSPALLGTSAKASAATDDFAADLALTEFLFATPIVLTPGDTYLLEILQVEDYFYAGSGEWHSTENGHPSPDFVGYAGGALLLDGSASEYGEDLIFATGLQRAADEPPTNGVPIAPTWALAALGLLAAGAARRHGRGMR